MKPEAADTTSSRKPRRSFGKGWRNASAIGNARRPANTVRSRPTWIGSRSATARRVATGVAPHTIMISPAVTRGAIPLPRPSMTGIPVCQAPLEKSAIEPDRFLVDVEQRLLLLAVGRIHFSQPYDLPHDLGVEAAALGLGIDLADVGRQARPLLLEPLDTLEERAQPLARHSAGLCHRSSPIATSASAPVAEAGGQYKRGW